MMKKTIYIHIDKRADNCPFESIENSVQKSHLFWVKQQRVNWGGASQIYVELNKKGKKLRDGIAALIRDYDVPCQINGIGSLACLYFTNEAVIDYETAKTSDVKRFGAYFHFMLNRGIYIGPSQFEAMFLSYAHTDENIQMTLDCVEQFFRQSK